MTTERLTLQLQEPGDDALTDELFDILCKALQPDHESTIEVTVTKITALIPGGRPSSNELHAFLMTCYEVAEQIPCHHASVTKLVTVIDQCYNTLLPKDRLEELNIEPAQRPYEMSLTLREWFNTLRPECECGPVKYINFQYFLARVYERGLLPCMIAIWTIQDAFERREGKTKVDRNAYVQAALQYLVIIGDLIFEEVIEQRDTKAYKWDYWYTQVCAVAAQNADEKTCSYSQDIVQLAGQALVAMEAIQRLKTG